MAGVAAVGLFTGVSVKKRWKPKPEPPGVRALAEFIRTRGISKAGILMSDWPGLFAFRTDNYVVSADMLTGNRRLVDQMRAATDGARVLLDYCADRGRPIEYVVCIGKPFLVPEEGLRSVVLYDPKLYPIKRPIGRIRFPAPPEDLGVRGVPVWHLPRDRGAN